MWAEGALNGETVGIDASLLGYGELNERVREAARAGAAEIVLEGVNGQRYIGTGVTGRVLIRVRGIPGNDLGAFMDGPTIVVEADAQDGAGNTMNSGGIAVRGRAGDVLGYGMRGGRLDVLGDVGNRIGIHMKAFGGQVPVVVVGGTAGDFMGEYMAGGVLVVLGLRSGGGGPVAGRYCGAGMHGGVMYFRGGVGPASAGEGAVLGEVGPDELEAVKTGIAPFCERFGLDAAALARGPYLKLSALTHRPYRRLYAY